MGEAATHLLATVGVDEAARLLGVNRHTLYRWAREGRVPAIRLGGSVRFRVKTLCDWMEQQEQATLRESTS